jgi:PAS domain S-box-containing protein
MIAVIDRAGNQLYNSPAYQKVLGYSPQDLKETSPVEQIHPEDRQRVLEAAEKTRLTGRGERQEYRIRHKDGTWRILESVATAIPNEEGQIERLVIVNRDITERQLAEETKNRSDQLFRSIAENSADLIAVVDQDGHRIYNNPAYERLLGYTPEELKGTVSFQQIHPDDRPRVTRAAQQALKTGVGQIVTLTARSSPASSPLAISAIAGWPCKPRSSPPSDNSLPALPMKSTRPSNMSRTTLPSSAIPGTSLMPPWLSA